MRPWRRSAERKVCLCPIFFGAKHCGARNPSLVSSNTWSSLDFQPKGSENKFWMAGVFFCSGRIERKCLVRLGKQTSAPVGPSDDTWLNPKWSTASGFSQVPSHSTVQPIYDPKAITHSSKQRGCPAAGLFFVTAQGRRSSGPSGSGNSPGETVVEMLNDILKNGWRNTYPPVN